MALQAGRRPESTSLDMAYDEGYIAGLRSAWSEVTAGIQQARDGVRAHMQRARSDNQHRQKGKAA